MDSLVAFWLGILASPYMIVCLFAGFALVDTIQGELTNRNVSICTWLMGFVSLVSLAYHVNLGNIAWYAALGGVISYLLIGFGNAVFWWKGIIKYYRVESRSKWVSHSDKTQREWLEERLNLNYGHHMQTSIVYFLLWPLSSVGNVLGIVVDKLHAKMRALTVAAIDKECGGK